MGLDEVVEPRQVDVAEYWTHDAALWRTTLCAMVDPGFKITCPEQFSKETVDLKNYSRLTGPFTLLLRGKAGFLAGPTVPDYERFRLGGTTYDYLRGYPDYYVVPRANITRSPITGAVLDRYPGGRTALILTSELQFPIADPLHGLLFFEAVSYTHLTLPTNREV